MLYCRLVIQKVLGLGAIIFIMFKEVKSEAEMRLFGELIGTFVRGGEFIELIGDVGSGKTTLTKGIAVGLGIKEYVQSPSFTISRVYKGRDNLNLAHYDFYRLSEAGIMANELQEVATDKDTVTIIEWAGIVEDILPADRLSIKITASTENSRQLELLSNGKTSSNLMEKLKQ